MASGTRGSVALAEEQVDEPVSAGRVCQEVGCATVLSRYNSTAWCGLHSRRDWRANREPRRRTTE